jgi:hypothetical protein
MALDWQQAHPGAIWSAETAEVGTPHRSIWRVIDTDGPDFDLWVESGITKQEAQKITSYPTAEEDKRAGDVKHATGEL